MDRDQEAKDFADQFSRFVNGMGRRDRVVAELMAKDHPTLQQNYMRFFMLYCEEMAKQKYTDLRNEASVNLAKEIVKLNKGLPYV
ncbi:hypothetical protein [Nitrospira sp. BLG_2]|uniref:hypothetical protein n=1 Tax=Nitrospira sp. BLG_2 TaxID=3397507 RepID=UPI003B9CBD71